MERLEEQSSWNSSVIDVAHSEEVLSIYRQRSLDQSRPWEERMFYLSDSRLLEERVDRDRKEFQHYVR